MALRLCPARPWDGAGRQQHRRSSSCTIWTTRWKRSRPAPGIHRDGGGETRRPSCFRGRRQRLRHVAERSRQLAEAEQAEQRAAAAPRRWRHERRELREEREARRVAAERGIGRAHGIGRARGLRGEGALAECRFSRQVAGAGGRSPEDDDRHRPGSCGRSRTASGSRSSDEVKEGS